MVYLENINASADNCGYPRTKHCAWAEGMIIEINIKHSCDKATAVNWVCVS